MAKKPKVEGIPDESSEMRKRLAAAGLTGIVRFAEEMPDLRVTCTSSGFPRLDRLINPVHRGIPHGADLEIYSKKPSDGKTTLALQMLSHWQKLGKKSAILDLERTITLDYLSMLKIANQNMMVGDQQLYAPVYVRPDKAVFPVEKVLDAIKFLCSPEGGAMDIIVVDSVGVMDTQKNLERTSMEEASQYGGIAGVLTSFMKNNIAKTATILWLNQAKQKMTSYGPPSYETVGGKAVKFLSSIRLELARIENIKVAGNNDESFGFKSKILLPKNKMGRDNCSVTMTYVPGEGFSAVMDYLEMGKNLGLITKSGAWFAFSGSKWQGEQQLYYAFRDNSTLLQELIEGIGDAEMPFTAEEPEENVGNPLAQLAGRMDSGAEASAATQ